MEPRSLERGELPRRCRQGDALGLASMEPRSLERGEQVGRVGAQIGAPLGLASMEPRSLERGEPTDDRQVLAHEVLQWSRAR